MKSLLTFFTCVSLFLAGCGKKHEVYQIGVDPSFFPLDIKGKEANLFGFSNELLQEISKLEGVRFARINMSWDNLIWGLKEKKYDAILSLMYPYAFNQKKFSFSHPYLLTGPVLIVRKSTKATSMKAMKGKEVGVEANSSEALLIDQYPNVLPREYITLSAAFQDLENLSIGGLLTGNLQASAYVDDLYQNTLKIATEPLNDEGIRLITMSDAEPKLIKAFNEGLKKLKDSGKYKELLKKWNIQS